MIPAERGKGPRSLLRAKPRIPRGRQRQRSPYSRALRLAAALRTDYRAAVVRCLARCIRIAAEVGTVGMALSKAGVLVRCGCQNEPPPLPKKFTPPHRPRARSCGTANATGKPRRPGRTERAVSCVTPWSVSTLRTRHGTGGYDWHVASMSSARRPTSSDTAPRLSWPPASSRGRASCFEICGREGG